MKLPLEGITVIDVAEVWAGPMGASLLGDLGATVIKVESFPRTAHTRRPGSAMAKGYTNNDPWAPRPWERSATHNMANRNKYGVTLNLTHPAGLKTFKRLAELADVLVEAFSAGTAEKLGIHYEAMKEIKPDLIMASMPGWGVQGPYQGYVSLGSGLDGFSGHYALRGYPDNDPSMTPVVNHCDAIGAITLSFAVLVAIHHRNRTGEGQWIDISQVEGFLPHLGRPLMDYVMNGRQPGPMGNRDHYMAPHGCYRCRGEDNWVVITVSSDQEWGALRGAMGDPEWAGEADFAGSLDRHENQDRLDALIQEWTQGLNKKEIMELLQRVGVPAQAVLNDEDLYADPHLGARGFFQRAGHPTIGEYSYPGYLWKLGKSPQPAYRPANGLGEHNAFVYGHLLGMSDDEIRRLEEQSIIGDQLL